MDPLWLALPLECAAIIAVPFAVQRRRWRTEDRRLAAERVARFEAFCAWVDTASLEELAEHPDYDPAWRIDG